MNVSSSSPPPHVLLVEDNPVFTKQITSALAEIWPHHNTTSCETGRQALQVLAESQKNVGLALVDLGLPDMDGVDVIHAIRERFLDIPIVVVSVLSSERNVLAAIRAGARGYILKGDSSISIAQAITEVLDGNYPISPALARILFRQSGFPDTQANDRSRLLSPREMETLSHIADGHTQGEIAALMSVKVTTIQTNIRNIYIKLDVHSQIQALNKAREIGLL